MHIVIVTGLSGSGKSEAMNVMEDMGFYCVDNLPPALLPKFVEVCSSSQGALDKVALGIDIRGYKFFKDLNESLRFMEKNDYKFDIIFLEADDNTLVRRYKMTRRKHPLALEDNIFQGIQRERAMLEELKQQSGYIINTTNMKPSDLKDEINNIFKEGKEKTNLIEDLKEKTGDDKEVRDYVMNSNQSVVFKEKLQDMIEFLIPNYIKEGKNHLVIAIGCTGGKHRSVTIANLLYDFLKDKGYRVFKKHRDYTLK